MPPLFAGDLIDAVLFDMDGTILSSVKAAERVWAAWATRRGLDVAAFLPTIHGVQAVETIRRLGLEGIDPETEAALITEAEIDDVEGIEAIVGAAAFVAALPPDRWAIVTSSPRRLALRRLEAAGLPLPQVLIAAEDVERGKPAPDCFLLAAERLGVHIARCLVFEDSAAGVAAAEAAGAMALVITATHSHPVETRHPTVIDYADLRVLPSHTGVLAITSPLPPSRASEALVR